MIRYWGTAGETKPARIGRVNPSTPGGQTFGIGLLNVFGPSPAVPKLTLYETPERPGRARVLSDKPHISTRTRRRAARAFVTVSKVPTSLVNHGRLNRSRDQSNVSRQSQFQGRVLGDHGV